MILDSRKEAKTGVSVGIRGEYPDADRECTCLFAKDSPREKVT